MAWIMPSVLSILSSATIHSYVHIQHIIALVVQWLQLQYQQECTVQLALLKQESLVLHDLAVRASPCEIVCAKHNSATCLLVYL